jgi:hypothetical protein
VSDDGAGFDLDSASGADSKQFVGGKKVPLSFPSESEVFGWSDA